jgi:acetyl esterase/lipase
MKALVWHGKEDVCCESVSDPNIQTSGYAYNSPHVAVAGESAGGNLADFRT